MLVNENEAYVLHEKRITTLSELARALNPLEDKDFYSHKKDVINWIKHSVKDDYLAKRLTQTNNRKQFVELLFLRQEHHNAKHQPNNISEEKIEKEAKVKRIIQKEKVRDELLEPKKFEENYSPKTPKLRFDFNDFKHLIYEARKDLEVKDFDAVIDKYEKLKEEFEHAQLSTEEKKRIHLEIKHIFSEVEQAL